MQTELAKDNRIALGGLLAVPLVLAIALPLYFSGTPRLRATTTARPRPATVIAGRPTQQETPPPVTPTPQSTAEPIPLPLEQQAAIDALLADREGVYGIIVADPASGARYSTNADVPFLAASLYKLVLLADVYAAIEDGLIAPDAELALLPGVLSWTGRAARQLLRRDVDQRQRTDQ